MSLWFKNDEKLILPKEQLKQLKPTNGKILKLFFTPCSCSRSALALLLSCSCPASALLLPLLACLRSCPAFGPALIVLLPGSSLCPAPALRLSCCYSNLVLLLVLPYSCSCFALAPALLLLWSKRIELESPCCSAFKDYQNVFQSWATGTL